jgi:nucleoside-diphosphate-sugar epimerase
MRVFLTGGTGYIGGAVAAALRERGHDLAALARPESDAKQLREIGVGIVAGDLASLPRLSDTLADYDAFVHTAQTRGRDAVALDKTAVDVFSAQKGFFLFTSGVWVLGNTSDRIVDESTPPNPIGLVTWRPPHEHMALANGRGAVLRPGCVYGGKQSLLGDWFSAADQGRPLRIIGDGRNRWAMVNLHDLADCYVRIAERRATGIFHGVDDTRAKLNECARAVAPSGRLEHVSVEVARQKMGPFVDALMIDQQVSSEKTRRQLEWSPRRTFLTSIEEQWREWRATLASAR